MATEATNYASHRELKDIVQGIEKTGTGGRIIQIVRTSDFITTVDGKQDKALYLIIYEHKS